MSGNTVIYKEDHVYYLFIGQLFLPFFTYVWTATHIYFLLETKIDI